MSYIIIQHYQFPVSDPFVEGHILSEKEANILNWHRASLIQKTMQRKVMEVINQSDDFLTVNQLDELAEQIKEFDSKYELGERRPPRQSILEHTLDLVANGVLLRAGEFEPSEEDLERVKRTPEVQARARDIIRSSTFSVEELLS